MADREIRDAPPPRGLRVAVGLAVTILFGAALWVGTAGRMNHTDFDYYWLGGVAAAEHQDPYHAVAEAMTAGRVHYPYHYPGPAALWLAPFSLLPLRVAFVLWASLGVGCLAFGVTRDGWWRLGILASAPLWVNLVYGQTGAWTAAAAVLPWLGWVYAAKPSIGLALWTAWPTRQALLAGAVLVLLSLTWLPGWPAAWWASVGGAPEYLAPIRRSFGWLLLLGWIRWRTPGGRLIGSLALIPHTTSMYEMLPLLLLARSRRELAILVGLGWLAYYGIYTYTARYPGNVVYDLQAQWPYILGLCYLPALALVFLRRNAALAVPSAPNGDAEVERVFT